MFSTCREIPDCLVRHLFYAGHYVVTEAGCGTECQTYIITDAVTGQVCARCAIVSARAQARNIAIDSQLMIIDAMPYCLTGEFCSTTYYQMRDGKPVLLNPEIDQRKVN